MRRSWILALITALWFGPALANDSDLWRKSTLNQIIKRGELRVGLDHSPEKIGAKIRRATLQKVPYMAIVGAREAGAQTVSVRHRTEGDLGTMGVGEFAARLGEEVASKGKTSLVGAAAG